MKRKLMTGSLAAAVLMSLAAVPPVADNDIDLPINGDFRGSPSGYSPAPGWTLTADGGGARILPTASRKDFSLELKAAPNRSQSVISESYPLAGNVLKLELKVLGSGTAAVGYETLDETRRTVIASDRQIIQLTANEQKVKRHFTLKVPARYIRIRLTAEAGSSAQFSDVDAEFSGAVVTAAPAAPGMIAAPPPAAPGMIAAPPSPTVQPASPSDAGPAAKLLMDDQSFSFSSLSADEHYEASVPVGSDVDFDLGEDPDKGIYWQLISYDASVCRVKLKHDRDGAWPFRRYEAEIELKALRPGKTDVIFSCNGKKFTVHFTAK